MNPKELLQELRNRLDTELVKYEYVFASDVFEALQRALVLIKGLDQFDPENQKEEVAQIYALISLIDDYDDSDAETAVLAEQVRAAIKSLFDVAGIIRYRETGYYHRSGKDKNYNFPFAKDATVHSLLSRVNNSFPESH
jgi:hypothetical protein